MLSCDTFALTKEYYAGSVNLLAKNSDRPLGEAQPLAFYQGGVHAPGEMLQCTHLTIPQAERTYTVLGSRPYWIWGFEMGVNECGLVIGNEAEGSRCEAESEEGLLGMDLLRLALERAASAREGVDVIASLLEKYGQNANASLLFDRRYENSFMLVDREEIWLLETAGRQWAARKVKDWAAISNCYSIGSEYDLCSAELESYARSRRWLRPDEKFDFSKAYTQPAARQGQSTPRWRRLQKLIAAHNAPLDRAAATAILRDHFDGEIIEPRWGQMYGGFVTICMHAMTWDVSQTAASLVSCWHDRLGQVSWYAPSVPCCSVYIPVYWTGDVPEAMKRAEGTYDENSLWWRVERLAMLVSADEARFGEKTRAALRRLEDEIALRAAAAEKEACDRLDDGDSTSAWALLAQTTEWAVQKVMVLSEELSREISDAIRQDGGLYGPRKEFLEDYSQKTKLPL